MGRAPANPQRYYDEGGFMTRYKLAAILAATQPLGAGCRDLAEPRDPDVQAFTVGDARFDVVSARLRLAL
jgi:hypothetical protein